MNTMRYCFAIGFAIAVAGSCSKRELNSKPFLIGSYECVAYNHDGISVVKGTLSINSLADDRFNGDWHLDNTFYAELNESEYINGTGDLVGTINQKEGTITSIQIFQTAIGLWMHIEGERILGILRWSGYAGGPELGRFEATRISHP